MSEKEKKIPLYQLLIDRNLFSDRHSVECAVIAGDIIVDDTRVQSASIKVYPSSEIRIKSKGEFVSRGGNKLNAAIKAFNVDVHGKHCLDIGASTGGFTDCLLQNGASHVTCVDVNYGQLSWEIRQNARVSVFERTNIKNVDPKEIGAPFDIVVIDVSFIGLSSLASCIANLCHIDSKLIALVKPQFESKRGESVGGVVFDESIRLRTVQEVNEALDNVGFNSIGFIESPIKGPSGNIEYLIYADKVK